jgi:hypothetical protein
MRKTRFTATLFALLVAAFVMSGSAAAQHNETGAEHLLGEGSWGKIEFLGKLEVPDAEADLIADLTVDVDGDYAYLARWGGEACAGPEGARGGRVRQGGVYIIDIRNLEDPQLVGFIDTHQDTLVGEGMQVVRITTPEFTGDVLVINHEGCGKNFKGGVSLWDVTDPLNPRKLRENFGDITIGGVRDVPDVNQTHSAFAWDAGDRAFLVSIDDEEAADVDIFDITDPKHPVLISELDLNEFDVSQPELGLTDSFSHDVVVKEIGGRFIMLVSYWDGGYVLLDVTDPANPVFLGDSDFANIDPELLEQTGIALTPEGNAHQAEFTIDNRFVIATDEDFAPFRLQVSTDDGDSLRALPGEQTTDDEALGISGTTVFVGRACDVDPAVAPAPDVGDAQIAVVERGLCTFQEKVENIVAAGGYEAVIIMNREGPDACTAVLTPSLTVEGIPVIFVGREAGFALFDQPFDLAACLDDTPQPAPIEIGTIGDVVTGVTAQFDGWGYVHLFALNLGSDTPLVELDTFAIPEAMDPAFAEGFGDLSVHEVAVDPLDPTLAYLSYYAGGLRAIQIQCSNPADTSTCELVEVGGYLDPLGNDFWGVETFVRNGETIILASDRDSGLWIFRDP